MPSIRRSLPGRGTSVPVIAGLVVALSTAAPNARAAEPASPADRLEIRESLVERVRRSGPRGEPVVDFVRRRRAEVELRLTGDVPAPDALTASTPVAVRVGNFVLETSLGADPRWRPGRRRALLRPIPDDPSTALRVRWTARKVRIELRTSSDVVLGDPGAETPDGPLARTFDAAAAFGDVSWFLRASVEGRIRRGELRLPGNVVPLRDVRISGSGGLVPPTDDPVAPAVDLTAPRQGFLNTEPVTQVTGEVLDDRAVARVTWSLDGGAETEIPVAPDPSLNPVRGQRVALDFGVPVVASGLHTLTIAAYDRGGSVATQDVDFAYVVPADLPLSTGGGQSPVSLAVVDGELFSWGDDVFDGLANGPSGPEMPQQPTATGLTGVRDVSMSVEHGLALLEDGRILAWGKNTAGKLGDGSGPSTVRDTPVAVAGIDDALAIATGRDFSLALRSDGTVWGWGWSADEQLGSGFTELSSPVPVQIEGLSQVVGVAAGGFQSIALLADGTVRCWGSSYVPMGGTPSAPGAVVMPRLATGEPLDDVAEVRSGGFHFLARRSDGTVWAWGAESSVPGALGLGLADGITKVPLPTRIPEIAGAVSIAAASDCGYAVLGDGTLLAWGGNSQGQVGDGTFAPRTTPVPVPGIADAIRVCAGSHSFHVLVQLRTNVVMGWGYYSSGNPSRSVLPSTATPEAVPFPSLIGD